MFQLCPGIRYSCMVCLTFSQNKLVALKTMALSQLRKKPFGVVAMDGLSVGAASAAVPCQVRERRKFYL